MVLLPFLPRSPPPHLRPSSGRECMRKLWHQALLHCLHTYMHIQALALLPKETAFPSGNERRKVMNTLWQFLELRFPQFGGEKKHHLR